MTLKILTPEQILDLPMEANSSGHDTIRGYLGQLLHRLWYRTDQFNVKRPFGYGDWEYEVYKALVQAEVVAGYLSIDGYPCDIDYGAADTLIQQAITALTGVEAVE